MAYIDTWNAAFEAVPADTDAISNGADGIRDLKVAVRERMAKDHYMAIAGTDVDHGEHVQVTLRKSSAKPTAYADKGYVYTKIVGSAVELFYENEDGQEVQLTNAGVINVPIASGAQVDAGTSNVVWVTPHSINDATIFNTRALVIDVVQYDTEVDTSVGIYYFSAMSLLNGMNLVRAYARVGTAGITGATTIQVRNMTKYSVNDCLSNAMSIASTATTSTAGDVNTSYDDIATNDLIKIYVTANSTTKPRGLQVILEYRMPSA